MNRENENLCLLWINIKRELQIKKESELKIRLMNKGRCDERLKDRVEESKWLTLFFFLHWDSQQNKKVIGSSPVENYTYAHIHMIFPVYVRRVDSSALVFSLSSHRHSYIGLVFRSRFIDQ